MAQALGLTQPEIEGAYRMFEKSRSKNTISHLTSAKNLCTVATARFGAVLLGQLKFQKPAI